MKKVLTLFFFGLVLLFSATSYAWNINCVNGSCVASDGALKVYWSSSVSDWRPVYALTGVEGLPITIDEYKNIEQRVSSAIEKSISIRKTDTVTATLDKKTDSSVKQENLLTEKQSVSKNASKNYNLLLVKWFGDTAFGGVNGIDRYLAATKALFDLCLAGKIDPVIKAFFIAQNAKDLDNLDLRTELNDDNKYLILTKYYGLTRFTHVVDPQIRYSASASAIAGLAIGVTVKGDTAEDLSKEFRENISKLNLLMEPGQTALNLYKSGHKDLAFAKWYVDKNLLKEHLNKMPLPDKYMAAISLIDTYKNVKTNLSDAVKIDPSAAGYISVYDRIYREFESAISKEDDSVKIVTVERKIPVYIKAVPFLIVLATLAVFIFKKTKHKLERKNNKEVNV